MIVISLKLCVILCLLSPLVLSEMLLYERGVIRYKTKNQPGRLALETTNVKYIDNHLIQDAITVKIISIIPHLHNGAIRNLPSLKNLSIANCNITRISPGAFQSLQNLKTLHLKENLVEVIEEGVFNHLPLQNLFLQRNRIHTIRSGAFDNMRFLRKIKLNKNFLAKWDSQWFRNTPSLTMLYFRRNQIAEIPDGALVNLRTSHRSDGLRNTAIFLSKNFISNIHPRAFDDVYALGELWLDRNKIERVDREIFGHFTEIKMLNLKYNRLEEIDRFAFKNMKSLFELDLSYNRKLTCIDYEVVASVNRVIIEDNNIDCSCLDNLKENIAENRLTHQIKIIPYTCVSDDQSEYLE